MGVQAEGQDISEKTLRADAKYVMTMRSVWGGSPVRQSKPSNPPVPGPPRRPKREMRTCYKCGKTGHIAINCPTAGGGGSGAGAGGRQSRGPIPLSQKRCYICGKLGHIAANCPEKK